MRIRRHEFRWSHKRVFAWLMVASAATVLLPRSMTDGVDHLCSILTSPLNLPGRAVSLAAVEKLRTDRSQPVAAEEYHQLSAAYQRKCAQVVNLELELQKQLNLLGRIQGLRQRFGMARAKLIDARIVGADTSSWRRVNKVLVKKLDQGTLYRIQPGQIALAFVGHDNDEKPGNYDWCVVGKVLTSSVGSSNLQLACDADFSLGVFVEPGPGRQGDWRAEGILQGDGADRMVCMVSPSDYPVKVGDAVVACSDPSTLPVATLIGYVQHCQRDDKTPLMWRIIVAPAIDLNTLDRVVVIDSQ